MGEEDEDNQEVELESLDVVLTTTLHARTTPAGQACQELLLGPPCLGFTR